MRELSKDEIKEVSGGVLPVAIKIVLGAACLVYSAYAS